MSVLLLAPATTGCGDDTEDDIDIAIDDGRARGLDLSVMASQELGPQAQEVAMSMAGQIMLTINEGEIMQAVAVLDQCDEGFVCDYAENMIDDHTAHSGQVIALLDRFGLMPLESRVSAALREAAATAIADIQASTDPDFDYMQIQVMMHESAVVLINGIGPLIADPEFSAFLIDTELIIQNHSEEAQETLRRL